jgi:hypothetical protein
MLLNGAAQIEETSLPFPPFACAATFSNMCSTQADKNSRKLRLRCGFQFPWCALALTPGQSACNAVLAKHCVQKHGVPASAEKTPGTNGRLSLIDFEDLFFRPYIVYRIWTASIPSHSVKCSRLSESTVNRKESKTIWHSQVRVLFSIF